MLKKVTFIQYQLIRKMHKVTVITANDTEAVILIGK